MRFLKKLPDAIKIYIANEDYIELVNISTIAHIEPKDYSEWAGEAN